MTQSTLQLPRPSSYRGRNRTIVRWTSLQTEDLYPPLSPHTPPLGNHQPCACLPCWVFHLSLWGSRLCERVSCGDPRHWESLTNKPKQGAARTAQEPLWHLGESFSGIQASVFPSRTHVVVLPAGQVISGFGLPGYQMSRTCSIPPSNEGWFWSLCLLFVFLEPYNGYKVVF